MTITMPMTDPAAEAEALFREARMRTRTRRRRRAAAAGIALALATVVYAVISAGDATPARSAPAGPVVNRAAFAGHGRLAFVSQGRLYLLDGSTLTAVSGPGQDVSSPEFSPDGRWLTYHTGSGREYLARADGTDACSVGPGGGTQDWLPDGELVAGHSIWRVSAGGMLTRIAAVPPGLTAWSSDGNRFVFYTRLLHRMTGGRWSELWRLNVARSLGGARTTWFTTRASFTVRNGINGSIPGGVLVLPGHAGILFRLDPDGSASIPQDGLSAYLLRAPNTKPVVVAGTVGFSVTVGAHGSFALTNGLDRYATLTKNVDVCSAAAARCTSVPARRGQISFDPAFAPGGVTLAYIQAPPTSQADFAQQHVVAWYATHTLWTLAPGGAPREIPGAGGASTPTWSADGTTILYTAHDALWLASANGRSSPTRIAGPLFDPHHWPASWFQVDWQDQFAWSS